MRALGRLSRPIHVVLSTVGIANNLTDDATTCDKDACLDRYDIGQQSAGACRQLLKTGGYSCEQHFCPTCLHAGFCDAACGVCVNGSTLSRQSNGSNISICRLPSIPHCSYLDTHVNRWRIDGEVVARCNGVPCFNGFHVVTGSHVIPGCHIKTGSRVMTGSAL